MSTFSARGSSCVRDDDAASARHMFDDDLRMAWNVTDEVLRDGPAVQIEAAARSRAHDDRDGLVLVEVGSSLGGSRRRGGDGGNCGNDGDARARHVRHGFLP
jgi:hypothetical protein